MYTSAIITVILSKNHQHQKAVLYSVSHHNVTLVKVSQLFTLLILRT